MVLTLAQTIFLGQLKIEQNIIMKEKPLLSIISPCYNEEATLQWSAEQLCAKLSRLKSEQKIHQDSFICLIDDGSADNTWKLISKLSQEHPITGIKLSTNVGHQNTLAAGLHYVADKCDCSITIDIDLQDDIEVMDTMLEHHQAGYHLVMGIRANRPQGKFYQKVSAILYYKLLPVLGIHTVVNHGDYRLLSQKAMTIFADMKERHLYLRGLFINLPLPHSTVEYQASKRQFGKTHYTMTKQIRLAWDGISSYSIAPLRVITITGAVIFILSLLYSIYALGVRLFGDDVVPGWASTVIPIYFLGGLLLFSLGIVGEYIGKIYMEIKQRPLYFIEKTINELDHHKNSEPKD